MLFNNLFYSIKPIIPRGMQLFFRRKISNYKRKKYREQWPIDRLAGKAPENWKGWPDKKRFALVLSHDVDTQKGHDAIPSLIIIEKEYGFRSTFNIVPERYNVSKHMIDHIKEEGFEVNIHGLKHDGKLFKSRHIFNERAIKINQYLKQWNSSGFTAPSMICNPEWIHDLNINHSTCTFDTDPFEPQPMPSKTIFPFLVKNKHSGKSYVELPYTLPQDHALFVILKETDIAIWKQKLKWIVGKGGMALLNTHPDYMRFDEKICSTEEYPESFYIEFLKHIISGYEGQYWNALPSEIARFWKLREVLDN